MESAHTETYRGFDINIYQDDDALDPRENFEPLGTMVCFHNNYNLGDKHNYTDAADAVYQILLDLGYETEAMNENIDGYASGEFIERYWPKFEQLAIVLPLYLYDHSGITMSTSAFSCPWDSGQVGFIYISKVNARKEYGRLTKKNLARVVEYMTGEVKEYDSYLTGDVYGYNVEPVDSNKSIDCDDSCWGFYGWEYAEKEMISNAKSAIDYEIKRYKKETVQAVKDERKRKSEINSFMACCWAV
jgi:hypothetical protein